MNQDNPYRAYWEKAQEQSLMNMKINWVSDPLNKEYFLLC